MKRRIGIIMVLSALVASPALACSCMPQPREKIIEQSDAVFAGTVQSVVTEGMRSVATIQVSGVTKGNVGSTVQVSTAANSAACGVMFQQGQQTEIAAIQRGSMYSASLCSQLGLNRPQ